MAVSESRGPGQGWRWQETAVGGGWLWRRRGGTAGGILITPTHGPGEPCLCAHDTHSLKATSFTKLPSLPFLPQRLYGHGILGVTVTSLWGYWRRGCVYFKYRQIYPLFWDIYRKPKAQWIKFIVFSTQRQIYSIKITLTQWLKNFIILRLE